MIVLRHGSILLENSHIFLLHGVSFAAARLLRTHFSALLAHLLSFNKSTLAVHLSSVHKRKP